MSKETIKLGDVVKLKSGGPAMTVLSIIHSGLTTKCTWFDKDGSVKTE